MKIFIISDIFIGLNLTDRETITPLSLSYIPTSFQTKRINGKYDLQRNNSLPRPLSLTTLRI